MGCLIFYANDNGLYPVSDNEPPEGFIGRKKLNQKPTLKHKGSNETERCEMGSRGSAAKPSEQRESKPGSHGRWKGDAVRGISKMHKSKRNSLNLNLLASHCLSLPTLNYPVNKASTFPSRSFVYLSFHPRWIHSTESPYIWRHIFLDQLALTGTRFFSSWSEGDRADEK